MDGFVLRKVNWVAAVSMNYHKGQDRDNVAGTKKGEMGAGEFPLLLCWWWAVGSALAVMGAGMEMEKT